GTSNAFWGDSTNSERIKRLKNKEGAFDLGITSPPYGDSQTTVQYGGISSLCLGVLKHLKNLQIPLMSSASIDRCCLGGSSLELDFSSTGFRIHQFWNGPTILATRVFSFLED